MRENYAWAADTAGTWTRIPVRDPARDNYPRLLETIRQLGAENRLPKVTARPAEREVGLKPIPEPAQIQHVPPA